VGGGTGMGWRSLDFKGGDFFYATGLATEGFSKWKSPFHIKNIYK
jgi:hypothetical protein